MEPLGTERDTDFRLRIVECGADHGSRITDHEPGAPDHARTHWPSKAISSQSIGAQWIGIDIATNEAGRANQLRIVDW